MSARPAWPLSSGVLAFFVLLSTVSAYFHLAPSAVLSVEFAVSTAILLSELKPPSASITSRTGLSIAPISDSGIRIMAPCKKQNTNLGRSSGCCTKAFGPRGRELKSRSIGTRSSVSSGKR